MVPAPSGMYGPPAPPLPSDWIPDPTGRWCTRCTGGSLGGHDVGPHLCLTTRGWDRPLGTERGREVPDRSWTHVSELHGALLRYLVPQVVVVPLSVLVQLQQGEVAPDRLPHGDLRVRPVEYVALHESRVWFPAAPVLPDSSVTTVVHPTGPWGRRADGRWEWRYVKSFRH